MKKIWISGKNHGVAGQDLMSPLDRLLVYTKAHQKKKKMIFDLPSWS